MSAEKKISSTKGCAITPRCGVSDAKRERARENLLVLIGRAITKTKMREKRGRKRGRINCRGIKGEGQMYVKEESEPQVHGAFERNDPLVACEPPFFATFSIYALPRIVSILLCSLQASVFFKGILNYDESREIKRYFTFLWYILKYIGTTEKFQNIRLLLSIIVKNIDLAFNKRKFEIFVSWLQYCDGYSNITSFDQFKILISMKARMYNFLSKILDVIHLSIFLLYIGFSFQKMLKSGQFTCLKKRRRKLKRWFEPS